MERAFRAFSLFIKGVNQLHPLWKIWLTLMMIINGVLPLFFLPHTAAIIVLTSVFIGFYTGLCLCFDQGFTKFLGLMHMPWIPMVVYQAILLSNGVENSNFKNWLMSSFVISCISLLIDFWDIHFYLKNKK